MLLLCAAPESEFVDVMRGDLGTGSDPNIRTMININFKAYNNQQRLSLLSSQLIFILPSS